MNFASGVNYMTDVMIKIMVTTLGLLATSTLAILVSIVSVHDSPEMVFIFLKISFELITFTIPALLGLSLAFVVKTISIPFIKVKEKVESKIKWYFGVLICGIFFMGLYLPTAFSQKSIELLGKQSLPIKLTKKLICSSHNIAKYKYKNYTAPQVVESYECLGSGLIKSTI